MLYQPLFKQIIFTTRAKKYVKKKGSTFKPRTRSEPKGSLRRRAVHTQKQYLTTTASERLRETQNWTPQKWRATWTTKWKSGAEQRLIFRAPGRLLPSVPDGVASQKGHFAEFLPEWLRWLGISEREDFFNVPDIFRGNESTWSNFKTSQITGESIIQNVRNKVSIFLSLTIVSFLDVTFKWHCQLDQVNSIVLFVTKNHVRLEPRNNDVNWEGTSSGRETADVTKRGTGHCL